MGHYGEMTADRCIACGGHWCCLRIWTGLEVDAHHPVVIISSQSTAEPSPQGEQSSIQSFGLEKMKNRVL